MREFGEEQHRVTSVSVWEGNKNIGDQQSQIFILLTICLYNGDGPMLGTRGHRVFSSLMTNLTSCSALLSGLLSKSLENQKKNCQIFQWKCSSVDWLAGGIFINCKSGAMFSCNFSCNDVGLCNSWAPSSDQANNILALPCPLHTHWLPQLSPHAMVGIFWMISNLYPDTLIAGTGQLTV